MESKEVVNKYASALANELLETNLLNVEDVQVKCRSYLRMCHKDIINKEIGEANLKFIELIEKQQKCKLNSPEYVKLGVEMAKLKPVGAAYNSQLNNMKREDRVTELEISIQRICQELDFWRAKMKELHPDSYEQIIESLKGYQFLINQE